MSLKLDSIKIFFLHIPVHLYVYLVGSLVFLFVYWYETKRDGFDQEKSFDLAVIHLVSAYILSRFFYALSNGMGLRETVTHLYSFSSVGDTAIGLMLGLILPLFAFPRLWRWSLYRISDILALATSLGLSSGLFFLFFINREFVYAFIGTLYFVLFITLSRFRLRYMSGYGYTLFLVFNILFGLITFRSGEYLVFYSLLFTISAFNIYYRESKSPMKSPLSSSFIRRARLLLSRKEKELKAEKDLLIKEDPYMDTSRLADNEMLDDVNEDIQKRVIDLRLSSIASIRNSIRRALAMIKLGKYGVCEVCGEPIGEGRLKAYPEATTCVKHSN